METRGRVLLIGEDNPYGADPEFALYCYPPGCAGYRLRRIFGLSQTQYLGLHRTNLCTNSWATPFARKRAFELLSPDAPWRVMVLLGRKVATTFEKVALEGRPLVAFSTTICCPGMRLVALPHPSGRNLVWNKPWAMPRARDLLREVAPEIPWGSTDAVASSEATA